MNPYENLSALRVQLANLELALEFCEAHEIVELAARYDNLSDAIEYWEEKIADWVSDHA